VPRPYSASRPVDYPKTPAPIRSRRGLGPLPPGPRGFGPLLTLRFLADTPRFLLNLHRTYGDAASFFLGGQLFIAVFTPTAVVDVTVKKQHSFVKGVGFERMHKVLGRGLLTNEEPVHLRHRRMMQPPFHHTALNDYARIMRDIVQEHLSAWEEGQEVSANEEMMRLTFQIVARLLFSTDIDTYAAGVQHHMGVAIDRIERTMLPGFDRFDESPLPYFRKFKESANYLAGVAEDIIARRVASGTHGTDLLGLLLDARDDENQPLSHDDVRDETLTLILSGHETTANVMTWAVAYLRDRDDVWAQVAEEAHAFLPQTGQPNLRDVLSAPVTKAVFSEALRLAPPVWVSPRRALEDVEVDGIAIPRGAHVLISQYASHRNAAYFPQPDEFLPKRWNEDFESALPRGAYFPFLAGARKCLGDQFALLEAHIILMEMARTKRPRPVGQTIPKPEPRATFRPHGAVPSLIISLNR
jgi:cytochrome P450